MAVTAPPRRGWGADGRARPRTTPLLARVGVVRPRRRIAGYLVAVLGTFALTASLLPVRSDLTPLSKGFGYLVVVVLSASIGGFGPGILASFLGFLTFNFFFLPPYNTFIIGRGEYVAILFVFLALSVLISVLLARATERADAAEAREEELRALQNLSAELTSAVPGPETYELLVSQIVEVFGFSAASLFVPDPVARELREVVAVGVEPGRLEVSAEPGGGDHPAERVPLTVSGRVVGLLLLRADRPTLSPAESRVLRAFCDQFALVLERDRLLRVATETEVLRQADQVRKSLLAAVSHDLRSPLATIKASVTDLLSEDAAHTQAELHDALESIDTESDRLADLVSNLLDMSRIEGGMLKANLQVVDLHEAISGAAGRLRRTHPELALRLDVPRAELVRADPAFLDRVIANLVDNAVRAATESATREIEIEARSSGARTEVRVIDHGHGVPASVREQLFYPFYQLSQRHPRLGTGLGLPISKGFLAVMDGEIWVEDTPGGGATFAFSIPSKDGAR
jgi:two-component system, OmpR family, sensor histidine kinase KdpD